MNAPGSEMPALEEIAEATRKILADPLLHRFFNWSVRAAREVGRRSGEKGPALPATIPIEVARDLVARWLGWSHIDGLTDDETRRAFQQIEDLLQCHSAARAPLAVLRRKLAQ